MSKSGGISHDVQQQEVDIAKQQEGIAQSANQRAGQLFQASFPGFEEAENYYKTLASGDPAAIARAIAPAAQQINQQSQAAAQRIEQDSPRGGEKNLALEENQITRGAQVGNLASQSYLSAFQNLAGLAGQGVGESTSQTGAATAAGNAAGNQYSNIANQQAEAKATNLGFYSSLAGSAAEMAAVCWVAIALWGAHNIRTAMVRWYFMEVLQTHWLGRYAYMLYRKYGRSLAKLIEQEPVIRWGVALLFNGIYRRAQRHLGRSEYAGSPATA